ncbi:MAG: fibronectin type III domain-containing protein [Candidatus Aminicenantales bacterium]
MTRRVLLGVLLSGLMTISGCGKKGPIAPPLVRVPQTVQDFAVFQKGRQVFLQWVNPTAHIDGQPIGEVAEIEIWLIREDRAPAAAAAKYTSETFENKAKLLTRIAADQFGALRPPEPPVSGLTYAHAPQAEDYGRATLTFALRVRDEKKRASDFSKPLSLELLPPPSPPGNLRAEVFEHHIQICWEETVDSGKDAGSSKLAGYNLYRWEGEGSVRRLNSAPVNEQEYTDKDIAFDRVYRYFVRAVLESALRVESEDSERVEVIARDIFPPIPPSGLRVIGGSGFIALSWEANRESDLQGYKVWRMVAGEGDFVQIASLTASESAFQDTEVEKKRRYEYAISAFDTAGNESRKSMPAGGIMRDSPPE